MDFLLQLDYMKSKRIRDEEQLSWYYVDSNNNLYLLEYISGSFKTIKYTKWYLTDYTNKKCHKIIDIDQFVSDNKDILTNYNTIFIKNNEFRKTLETLIGKPTFITSCVFGWCIKNSKINLKIIVEIFQSILKKTIQLQYFYHEDNSKNKHLDVSGKQLLTFLKSNIETINFQDHPNLSKQFNQLNISLQPSDDINSNIKDNFKDNQFLQTIENFKKKMFIKLPKNRRISYQTCLLYDENKQKLEQKMGCNLDL